ncbi:hypothetical protein ACROYT_G020502 [Oculina patagonica]
MLHIPLSSEREATTNTHLMGQTKWRGWSFGGRPFVFVSAKYTRDTKPDDAMYVWLENVSSSGFELCIREYLQFDGTHQDTIVDWFAFLGNGSNFNLTLVGEAVFPNNDNPTADDSYGFCQQVDFNTTFYSSPVAFVSVHHHYDRQAQNQIPPENNIITAWLEEVGLTSMKISLKTLVEQDASMIPSPSSML